MARKGRELEELVAALEEGLGDTGIKITSPDFIEDKTTKEKREVDISLKGKMGSNDILIIIECRDRKARQDVTWIEQIATKRDDIGAHKAIAVSSHGFSVGARDKARAKNIELRTLGQVDPKEIIEWFRPTRINIFTQKFNILRVDIIHHHSLDNSKIEELHAFFKSFSGAFPCNNKFISDPEAEKLLSPNDLILRNADQIFDNFKPNEEKMNIEINFIPQNKEKGFFALTPTGLIRMEYIKVNLEIWVEATEANIASVSSYQTDDTSLAQVISFDSFDIDGIERFAQIRRTPKGDIQRIEFQIKNKVEMNK